MCSILAGCAEWESVPAQPDVSFAGNPPARGACALEARPRAVELDDVLVGQPSGSRVVLENVGDESISAVTLDVEGSDGLTVVPNDAGPIAPGSTIEAIVLLNTGGPIEAAGTLQVRYECAKVRGGSIELPVAGRALPSCARIEPTSLEFETSLGYLEYQGGKVWGCASRRVRLESASIDGPDAGMFRFSSIDPFPVDVGGGEVEGAYPFVFSVEFTAENEGLYAARLQVTTDDPLEPVFEVPLQGRVTMPPCPVAVATPPAYRVVPSSIVLLDGGASNGGPRVGRPVSFEWIVLERPNGSLSQPCESVNAADPATGSPDDPVTPIAGFFVDSPGRYVLELRVRDALGRGPEQCPGARTVVEIVADLPPNYVATRGSTEVAVRIMPEGAADFRAEAYPPGYDQAGMWGVSDLVALDTPEAPIAEGSTLRLGLWNAGDRRVLGDLLVVCDSEQVYPRGGMDPNDLNELHRFEPNQGLHLLDLTWPDCTITERLERFTR
jgi:hypothetical protein